jgi:hypothetical protein
MNFLLEFLFFETLSEELRLFIDRWFAEDMRMHQLLPKLQRDQESRLKMT